MQAVKKVQKVNRHTGIETFVLLIHGYVRILFRSLTIDSNQIPLALLDLITKFCPRVNGTLHSWIIDKEEKLSYIFNDIAAGDCMESDPFFTKEPLELEWKLKFYPNGADLQDYYPIDEGECALALQLVTSLKDLEFSQIIVGFRVSCSQIISSQTTNIGIFMQDERKMLWSLQELKRQTLKHLYEKEKKIDCITLNVTVNVLRIINEDQDILYNFDPNLPRKHLKNGIWFDWKIDKHFWNDFQTNMTVKYESGIYWNMFLIEIQHTQDSEGKYCLTGLLKICCMEPGISKMNCNLKMMVLEANEMVLGNQDNYKFSLDVYDTNFKWRWWTDQIPLELLNKYQQITLRTFIDIIG